MPTRTLTTALVATLALLAGCGTSAPDVDADAPAGASAATATDAAADTQAVLAELGLDGLTGEEIVARLDPSTDPRPLDLTASVRQDEVLVGDGTTEVAVPLAGDDFYVSIAPYVRSTHECFFHSLAGCQGELVAEPVEVRITAADGQVLVDEAATTYTNGFVGFWLPKDVEGTIEVRHAGLRGAVPFSTTDGSPTCVTTLQLT
ncbi:CueP family metal-binding protein [Cellulomonas xiejunii]|uniref:CueP family metal-binding protein n=1 Tax=Cellulomonas xiejunii TaxID=2968083 RepID=A0ABY5KKX3_9CELL|nr:CueP family metal-binding protein [Cellulomonas xiejunii]MCC2320298.1 CueP family metal-binding protein [Cellulomonas xiejunii]UUI70603.1 CueP family metal-binding protein [Cellulomonas xiejunii]